MLKQSVFIADCLCGHHLKSPTRECVCPDCHRLIVFDWGRDSKPEDKPAIGRRRKRYRYVLYTLPLSLRRELSLPARARILIQAKLPGEGRRTGKFSLHISDPLTA
jgi:hypothetical protein